jgi:hypothetical protein
MRKLLSFLTATALAVGLAFGAGSAGLKTTDVVWPVATNSWPKKLWVYKVVPQQFSQSVVSNLFVITGFTEKDRTAAPDYLARLDRDTKFFGILEGTRKHLAICPALGYIEYHDGMAVAITNAVEGVPDQDQTTQLGLKYLRLLGMEVSEFATKTDAPELDLHWQREWMSRYDQKTESRVHETNSFGVMFDRQIDGIKFTGIGLHGGFSISFGNNSKIADLKLSWRNLKRYEFQECPAPEKIKGWILAGKVAFLQSRFPEGVSKLTISKVTFLYNGKVGDEPMDFVFPYAVFEATATSEHATNNVLFQCPMTLSQENWKAIK